MSIERKYGWKPQLPDHRDYKFSMAPPAALPPKVGPLGLFDRIEDQGQTSSCTGHAFTTALEISLNNNIQYSRLMAYYNARLIERNVANDDGAVIRDVIKGACVVGIANEALWPFDPNALTVRPSQEAFADAKKLVPLIAQYQAAVSLQQIKIALAAGLPVVFGFSVPESFESNAVAATGWFPMAQMNEQILGGHAVCAVGYDDTRATGHPPFIWVTNSWEQGWGAQGRFMMDQQYFLSRNWVSDCWIIHPK